MTTIELVAKLWIHTNTLHVQHVPELEKLIKEAIKTLERQNSKIETLENNVDYLLKNEMP